MTTQEHLQTILEAIEELRRALPLARAIGADTAYLEFLLASLQENAQAASRLVS